MPARATYRSHRGADRSAETRARIVASVRALLAEGAFHDCTVEDVARHAGVSRATLYQHFRSRLELIDAICDVMGENPALLSLRECVALPDPEAALDQTVAGAIRFWASEDAILAQLYGVAAVDPAANDFVARQRADRRGELERLAQNLRRSERLRGSEKEALAQLLVLTSYETYRELRAAGLSERAATKLLQDNARTLLLDG